MSQPRRWSIVYGFRILDPATMRVLVDYVGKTVQKLAARERQHRGQDFAVDCTEQPWSDLIVGKPFIVEEGLWTAAELAERERFHIHRLRPRYNHDDNLDNPARIPIPVARRQREERDAAKGVASPDWAAKGAGRGVPGQRHRRAVVPAGGGREWTRRQKRAAAWVGGWAALAAALSVGVVVLLPVALWHGVEFGAAGSAALLGAGRYVTLSRRKRKQIRRWVGGVVTAAVVAAVLWMVFAGQVASAVSR